MENKTKEELAELVRAQVAVIDGLTLELATRQPAAPGAPLVTVDTLEFWEVANKWAVSRFVSTNEGIVTSKALIDHIDAHTARAVAAAVKATHEQSMRDAAEIVAAERAAQPVAGELPPLPASVMKCWSCGEEYGLSEHADADGNCPHCGAEIDHGEPDAQPVQQPAAVVEQKPVAHALMLSDTVARIWFGDQESADRWSSANGLDPQALTPLYTAPVPTAGVQGATFTYSSTQATSCAGCGKHKHTPLRVDAMGGYVCLTCIGQQLDLLGEFGYAQPDSGRDAALEEAVQAVAARAGEAEQIMVTSAFDAIRSLKKNRHALPEVAAHPAPSSDAVVLAARALLEDSEESSMTGEITITRASYVELRASLGMDVPEAAAHPANGAQAGLSDTDRMNFMDRMGFTNLGRYSGMMQVVWMDDILDRHLTNGKDAREALDAAIFAAAKKGG